MDKVSDSPVVNLDAAVNQKDSIDSHDEDPSDTAAPRELLVATKLQPIDVQIDFLKREYDMIQQEIREIGHRSQSIRNWTITLWSGSVAFSIIPSQGNIKSFLLMSAMFPLMFWLQDIRWLQVQRIFIWRGTNIMRFVGSDALVRSINGGVLVEHQSDGLRNDLDLLFAADGEGRNFSSFWKVAFFQTNLSFYPVFIAASVVLHVYFNFEYLRSAIQELLLNMAL